MPSLTPFFRSDTLPYTRHQRFQREGITQRARGLPTHAPTLKGVSDLIESSENIGKGRSAPNMTNLPIWIVEKLPAQISPRRAAHYRPGLTRLISVLIAMGGPTHAPIWISTSPMGYSSGRRGPCLPRQTAKAPASASKHLKPCT